MRTKRTPRTGWIRLAALAPLMSFALLAGCSRDRVYDSGNGGAAGGCCRGATPESDLGPLVSARPDPARHSGGADGKSPVPAAPIFSKRRQKACPVTGAALGSMGAPVPVSAHGQTIYVCCQGCVARVAHDPDAFLRKVQAERGSL